MSWYVRGLRCSQAKQLRALNTAHTALKRVRVESARDQCDWPFTWTMHRPQVLSRRDYWHVTLLPCKVALHRTKMYGSASSLSYMTSHGYHNLQDIATSRRKHNTLGTVSSGVAKRSAHKTTRAGQRRIVAELSAAM